MLPRTFFSSHDENRMRGEGDLVAARARFFKRRPPNLLRLLEQRFSWMNEYIRPDDAVVEFGAGAGFSREFIRAGKLTLTDVIDNSWIDRIADASDPPYADESVDVLICSHMIHHLAHPLAFFRQAERILRPGGVLLIQDVESGFVLRLVSRVMRHEGWSFDVDVFDETRIANDPADPWSGNIAIPHLLFADGGKFESRVSGLRIEQNRFNECLLFLLSGGVIATTPTIQLPGILLTFVQWIDRMLIALAPGMFAMGRSVVLRKII